MIDGGEMWDRELCSLVLPAKCAPFLCPICHVIASAFCGAWGHFSLRLISGAERRIVLPQAANSDDVTVLRCVVVRCATS